MRKWRTTENKTSDNHRQEVFIFLAGLNFWEGLFVTGNIKFLRTIMEFQVAKFDRILMSIIIPQPMPPEKIGILKEREDQLQKLAHQHGVRIEFCHIKGRGIRGIIDALKDITAKTSCDDQRLIWASNYFNCFLGVLIKKRFPEAHLHFEMLGLVPEEELHYSDAPILKRIFRFLVLKLICRINFKFSDSISVISKRFKHYLLSNYRMQPSMISVVPCFYDEDIFYIDNQLRKVFRRKHQITDQQKLVFYSGMFQKYQMPGLLFSFFTKLQHQDINNEFRFMIITSDAEKARHMADASGIKDLIIESAGGSRLNGLYNAADIGVATRSEDRVSRVSSPAKIPEYLATQNSLILLESIGDYGDDLKNKKYAIVKKNAEALMNMRLSELRCLRKPDDNDMMDIVENYSVRHFLPVYKQIFDRRYRRK
jgi:glycosyltransferase involved in cell wall biosynthesis